MKSEKSKQNALKGKVQAAQTKTSLPGSTRCFEPNSLGNLQQLTVSSVPNSSSEKYISDQYEPPGINRNNEHVVPIMVEDHRNIIDLFGDIAESMELQIIQSQSNYATAMKKHKNSSDKMKWALDYLNCLKWWNGQISQLYSQNITVIKINISAHTSKDSKSIKLCRVKFLGRYNQEIVNGFMDKFFNQVDQLGIIYKENYVPFNSSYQTTNQRAQQNNTNPFHLQACAHYMVHKILSSSETKYKQISNKLEHSFKEFNQSFQNIKQSSQSLPTPMVNAIQMSKQIAEQIRNNIIKTDENTSDDYALMFPYIKIAVQKHIFDKLEKFLRQIYNEHCKKQSITYQKKSKQILIQYSISQIFDQILLPEHLRLINSSQDKNKKNLPQHKKRQIIPFVVLAYQLINIERLSSTSSIREKIKLCQIMYADLKSFMFEKLDKKYQLSSMEDIIPIFITIVLFCGQTPQITEQNGEQKNQNNKSLRSQLDMMIDYINVNGEEFEAEKRLLVNLSESYNYIVRDWKV